MDNKKGAKPYDYTLAGFDAFLDRSIDGNDAYTLDDRPNIANQQINYDQSQVSGKLGSTLQIADSITIDGIKRRISITDENGIEVTRLGKLKDDSE